MTTLPLPLPPAGAQPVRSVGSAVPTLAVAVALPLAAAASPDASACLDALWLLLLGLVAPLYAALGPVYRWLLADEPLLAGWLRGVDARLALGVLRTDLEPRARPLVASGLVLGCALLFFAVDDPWHYGFRPDQPGDWPFALALSMWLHADGAHLLGNLVFLWPMAAALEGRIPRGRLVALYLASDLAANAASLLGALAQGDGFAASIGASGAVSGLMGLFVVRCGFARVALGVPLPGVAAMPVVRLRIPAPVWAGLYFALDLSAALAPPDVRYTGVAHWAHVGGYLFGVAAALALGLHRDAARERLERCALAEPDSDARGATDAALDALLARAPDHLAARLARARAASRGARSPRAAADYAHALRLLLRAGRRREAARLFVEFEARHHQPLALADQILLTPALAALGEHDRAARCLADAARAPGVDPALHARALLWEGRLLETLALPDAARCRYEALLAAHPVGEPAAIAAARLAVIGAA